MRYFPLFFLLLSLNLQAQQEEQELIQFITEDSYVDWFQDTIRIFLGEEAQCEANAVIFTFLKNNTLVLKNCVEGKWKLTTQRWELHRSDLDDWVLSFGGTQYQVSTKTLEHTKRLILRTIPQGSNIRTQEKKEITLTAILE